MQPAPPDPSPPVGAIVLAGGQARRFDGRDKGLILLDGRPLAAWVIDRLSGQARELAVSANRNLEAYAALGHPVVADALPGQHGPLAGLYSAALALSSEWLLAAPCDTPFLPKDLAGRLLEAALHTGSNAVYAEDTLRPHYSILLFNRVLAGDLLAFLELGGRRVGEWLQRVGARPVRFEGDPDAFFNVNTPDALAHAEVLARRRS